MAALESSEDVLDLGSGSGMDAYVAGVHVTEKCMTHRLITEGSRYDSNRW
jgi:hypothetical protein